MKKILNKLLCKIKLHKWAYYVLAIYCKNCTQQEDSRGSMLVPCKDHPYYFHNRDYNCKYYKRKWWKIWV